MNIFHTDYILIDIPENLHIEVQKISWGSLERPDCSLGSTVLQGDREVLVPPGATPTWMIECCFGLCSATQCWHMSFPHSKQKYAHCAAGTAVEWACLCSQRDIVNIGVPALRISGGKDR